MSDLVDLNVAAADALRPRLLAVTAAPDWADALLAARPFEDLDALLAASDDIIADLDESQVDAALSGHPRIGEQAAHLDHESAARSAKEQAGMAQADAPAQDAMARGNATYEERFGRIYLAAAAGRSAEELLTFLHRRLDNDPGRELDVVRGELARITRLRLSESLEH
ncbi:MAG: 2-oxo-4-hydroxy-4-carboxy-5-ureidoimidazoline decarboxylase [Marmoricola sp.]